MVFYTVNQVATYLRESFESDILLSDLYVSGEISNLRRSASGHAYFTLKDDTALLNCVMFRGQQGSDVLEDGVSVSTHGRISFYEPRGSTDFIVDLVMAEGAGALSLEFDRLRSQLELEGLFDESRKRSLPPFPKVIGVVTSSSGAVLHDITTVVTRRYPLANILVSPTLVQGDAAPENIVQALNDLNVDGRSDVIVIARGGGSLEELWAFNDEMVARSIYGSKIPVVSAIGHETDFTISDYVADLRAPTPSAAAEMIVPDIIDLKKNVLELWSHINNIMESHFEGYQTGIEIINRDLIRGLPDLEFFRRAIDDLNRESDNSFQHIINMLSVLIDSVDKQLATLNPKATLDRGFVVVQNQQDSVVHSSMSIQKGEIYSLIFADGSARVQSAGK
ncbi:MAG: exodeoxyribonuclease VII large subunit [Dehalococcoidia bacterium]|nr:exodeoxyribonuclease VII large subunit [Dehalococcoidia bacterium]